MWKYEKRLQYPVNITRPNAEMAKVIISQFGGPCHVKGQMSKVPKSRHLQSCLGIRIEDVEGIAVSMVLDVIDYLYNGVVLFDHIDRFIFQCVQ